MSHFFIRACTDSTKYNDQVRTLSSSHLYLDDGGTPTVRLYMSGLGEGLSNVNNKKLFLTRHLPERARSVNNWNKDCRESRGATVGKNQDPG